METTIKKSPYMKFLAFFGKKKNNAYKDLSNELPRSIFDYFLLDFNKRDPNYESVKLAITLCDEALRFAKQRIVLVNRTKVTEDKIEEINYFDNLEESDLAYFKIILNRYVGLVKERNVLRNQITGFDRSVGNLFKLEKDAKFVLPKIEDTENIQRIFRQDLNHIEGEKMELEDEEDILLKGKMFLKSFAYALVGISVFVTILLCFLNVFYQIDIFLPTAILVVLIIIMGTFIVVFQQKINRDLKINAKLRNRAIELLNRKNVVYARHTNFLRYTYKKYKVTSSKELAANLRELDNYKHLTGRIDSIRKVIRESELEIDEFLIKHGIPNNKISLVDFAETINIDDQKRYFDSLNRERDLVESSLTDLDEKHRICWDKVIELKVDDETPNQTVSEIIKAYYSEIDKLMVDTNQT